MSATHTVIALVGFATVAVGLLVSLGQGFGVITTGIVVLQIVRYQKRDGKADK